VVNPGFLPFALLWHVTGAVPSRLIGALAMMEVTVDASG
jgi:hypothetical protein